MISPNGPAIRIGRCGCNRLDVTVEDREQAIAGCIDQASVVLGNSVREERAMGVKRFDGGALVVAHEPWLADHVRAQYRRKFTLALGHAFCPATGMMPRLACDALKVPRSYRRRCVARL